MEQFRTIPEMLIRHASQHVNARAVNDRVGNAWLPVSMNQIQQRVSTLAVALDDREVLKLALCEVFILVALQDIGERQHACQRRLELM